MASYNKIELIGNVGRVDVKEFNDGRLVNVSLATSERFTRRDGQKMEQTDWHNVVFNGSLAEVVEKYVEKGTCIFVSGRLRYRKYTDRDGNERTATEIQARELVLLGSGSKTKSDNDLPF